MVQFLYFRALGFTNMPSIRLYTNWNKRSDERKIEPFRKYVFICEGANTEVWYFRELINLRKQLRIHSSIELQLWEKIEKDRDISYPMNLIQFAEREKDNVNLHFDRNHDKMVIVFDADIFSDKVKNYDEVVALGEKFNDVLGITRPNFELFLLLHFPNSYKEDILPNMDKLLKNEKIDGQRFSYRLLFNRTNINSKTNKEIGNLAKDVDIAIEQEKFLNQDIHQCLQHLTSNIGKIIETIRNDGL